MKTSLKIYAKSDDTTVTTTLGYIKSTVPDATLKAAAQALNALTSNIYDRAEKIVVYDLESEASNNG